MSNPRTMRRSMSLYAVLMATPSHAALWCDIPPEPSDNLSFSTAPVLGNRSTGLQLPGADLARAS